MSLESGEEISRIDFAGITQTTENFSPNFISTPIADISTDEQLLYRAISEDRNGDSLTYSAVVNPNGLAVSPNGLVSWRPTVDQVGTHDVILKVDDGRGGIDLQSFQIGVELGNQSPIFEAVPQEPIIVPVGQKFSFDFDAFDPDGDAITYRLSGTSYGGPSIDPNTGELTWYAQFNTFLPGETSQYRTFNVVADDGNGGQGFTQLSLLAVEPTLENQVPEITSTANGIAALDRPYFYSVTARDLDGDSLTYRLLDSPEGMVIDPNGLIAWQPDAEDFGDRTVTVEVSDYRGGTARQTFNLNVVSQVNNSAPAIVSNPALAATVGRQYAYDLEAIDPDGDLVALGLDSGPIGMRFDAENGKLLWTPTAEQLGPHQVSIRASDPNGASTSHTFEINVRGINVAPIISSTPSTQASVGNPYRYQVKAIDIEGDTLSYRLTDAPEGAQIDELTGLVEWIPDSVGASAIAVEVSDRFGASTDHSFYVFTAAEAINRAPAITSAPTFDATPGETYSYQVTASDPNPEDSFTFQLLNGSAGMEIDSITGLLSWAPTADDIGRVSVTVGAVDESGAIGSQRFNLEVSTNTPPEILSEPKTAAAIGEEYQYDLRARDVDGDSLSYELVSAPEGMTVDNLGRIRWTPDSVDAGPVTVEVAVIDSRDARVNQQFELEAAIDDVAPQVEVLASNTRVGLGESISLLADALDNVGVSSLSLTINGVEVPLDWQSFYQFEPDEVGDFVAIATATDAAGNTSTAKTLFTVFDSSDVEAPQLELLTEQLAEFITAPTDLIGTVADDNLNYYSLSVAPIGTDAFTEIFRSSELVTDGILGTFDPTLLQNDAYTLRLEAVDLTGNTNTVEQTVNVSGGLKLGNFQVSFTDLAIPVSGFSIAVTRTYDSLNSNATDDFGYGWRMEFRDTDLRTSLGRDESYEQFGIRTQAFDANTRVFITLPGGERKAFTFAPEVDSISAYFPSLGQSDPTLYRPRFKADAGVTVTLEVEDVRLARTADGSFVGLNGSSYNPEDAASGFGGYYKLTTREGLVYRIDAATGDLESVENRYGDRLTFSDDSIVSSAGKTVTFERDAKGRISALVDPEGNRVRYEYDAAGDLIAVTDRENNTTQFGYSDDRSHFLDTITDPLGRQGIRSDYDESGRLSRIFDATGEAISLTYEPENSIEVLTDVYGASTLNEYNDRGNIVRRIDALGNQQFYEYDNNNNQVRETFVTDETGPQGSTTTATYRPDRKPLTVTDATGATQKFFYDANGNVTTVLSPLGEQIRYTHDELGNILSTTDAAGRVLQTTYDRYGRPITFTDPDGNTSTLEYDSFGNITRTTDFFSNPTTYTYDIRGQRLTETHTVTNASGVAEELTTRWTYDSEGRVTATEDPAGNITSFEYDAVGNMTAITDAKLQRTELVYNDRDRLVETIYADATPEDFTDNPRSIYLYDRGGRLRGEIDANGEVVHYAYDVLGRVTEVIYPWETESLEQLLAAIVPGETLESVDWTKVVYPDETPEYLKDNPRTSKEYFSDGKVKALTDRMGNRTQYTYNASERLVETIFADDTPDDLADNLRSITLYDRRGRIRAQIDAGGHIVHYSYDAAGRIIEEIYPKESDSLEQFLAAIAPGEILESVDWAEVVYPDEAPEYLKNNPRVAMEYLSNDRVKSRADALGNRTEYRYDKLGRLTETILADDTPDTLADNARVRVEYNEIGQVVKQIDPLGQETQFTYNKAGDLVRTTYNDGTSGTNTFNELGQQTSTTDQEGKTTQYDYDPLGRLKGIVDALDGRTDYTYDPLGLLVGTTDANQISTRYEYDSLGRRTGIELPEGERASYGYDANGNLTSYTDFNGATTTYEYDALNRLVTADYTTDADVYYTYTPTGKIETLTDGRGITRYEYDFRDRLISRTDPDGPYIRPDGPTIEYTYDDASNRTSVITPHGTTTYTFDAQNRLETITDPDDGVTTYHYDLAGRLIKTELPNSTEERRGYDSLNRLTSITTVRFDSTTGQETVIAGYEYTLDKVGHRLQITEHDGRITRYVYDDLYRLVQERITDPNDPIHDGRTISYTYDRMGNRLTRQDSLEGVTAYTYNDNYQLLAEVRSVDGEINNTITYSYDSNGNLLSRAGSDGSSTLFEWNDANRLSRVVLPNGNEIFYVYDSTGIQVSSTINGETTTYVVDKNRPYAQVLESLNSDGLIEFSVYGLDLIAKLRGDETSVFHTDGLGSTRVVTDGERNVQQSFDYLAFGELLGAKAAEQVDNLFAGEQFEQELGLYYLRQRYYDPNTGRFISRDAFEGFIIDPLSQNRYLYAHANPVTYTDPSGYFSIGNVSASKAIKSTLSGLASRKFIVGAALGGGSQLASDYARGERSSIGSVLFSAAAGGLGFVFGPTLVNAMLQNALGTWLLSGLLAKGLADSYETIRSAFSSGDPSRKLAGLLSVGLDLGLFDGIANPRALLRGALDGGAIGFRKQFSKLSDNIRGLTDNFGGFADNLRGKNNGLSGADDALDPGRLDTIGGKANSASPFSTVEELAELGVQANRVRPGTNGKVALIGRGMSQIGEKADILRGEGFDVEIFDNTQIPQRALDEFDDVIESGANLVDFKQIELFELNRQWAQKLKDQSYTVIDTGDPIGRFNESGFSIYYTLEKSILFPGD